MISRKLAKKHINYDPVTGVLTCAHTGRTLFTEHSNKGLRGVVCGHRLLAHRIAWLLHFGTPLPEVVGHSDGNITNNAADNLVATKRRRVGVVGRKSRSGTTGVNFNQKQQKWTAWLRREYLGTFKHKKDAVAARIAAEAELIPKKK